MGQSVPQHRRMSIASMNNKTGMRTKVIVLFGTRPEVIKLAPVIQHLEMHKEVFETVNVTSAQHTDLLYPFIRLFDLRIDYDLRVMEANQTPSHVCSRVLSSLDPVLCQEKPDLILVQGDTTTAMAGALAGFHRRIPVGHVEAGLRSGNRWSPYPEEMNRLLITRLATYHFAATQQNLETLLSEGVSKDVAFVTGNPVVDSLQNILRKSSASAIVEEVLAATKGLKRVVVTAHRRENLGAQMADHFKVLRCFVERHEDAAMIFPVHPNPEVVAIASRMLSRHPRIHLMQPMDYQDFVILLSAAWLIVSDSGGIQEEAPTLGKPLLVTRDNTERREAIESGSARLVGAHPERLADLLEEVYQDGVWAECVARLENPFGRGDSGKRIVHILAELSGAQAMNGCPA